MSRTVPKADSWSRINKLEKRTAALERVSQSNGSAPSGFVPGTFAVTGASLFAYFGAGLPQVDVAIGPSGLAKVELSAELLVPGSAADVSVVLSGTGPGGATFCGNTGPQPATLYLNSGLTSANVTLTTTTVTVIGPLTPGQWAFTLLAAQPSASGTAHVLNPFLQITPL